MRTVLVIAITLATACSGNAPPDGGGQQQLPAECANLVCSGSDLDCASYPYDALPASCGPVCSTGRCCLLDDEGQYQVVVVDCDRPQPDAGVDAP